MVVQLHERLTLWKGIAMVTTRLAIHACSREIRDVISRVVSWSHGVVRGNFVVKHVERVILVGCSTGFSLQEAAVIVMEHEGLAVENH